MALLSIALTAAIIAHTLRAQGPSAIVLHIFGVQVRVVVDLHSAMSRPQRVQEPNIEGVWPQIPLRVWFWEPETSIIGYLDPLGKVYQPATYVTVWHKGHCMGNCNHSRGQAPGFGTGTIRAKSKFKDMNLK